MYYDKKLVPHMSGRPVSPGFVNTPVAPAVQQTYAAPLMTSQVIAAPAVSYVQPSVSYVQPVVQQQTYAVAAQPTIQRIDSVQPAASSRYEYVPYNRTVVDYQVQEYVEQVPVQRTVTEYQERRYMETIPREVVTVDYQAIEHIKQYVPQIIPERTVETYPVERIIQRTEYIPVER